MAIGSAPPGNMRPVIYSGLVGLGQRVGDAFGAFVSTMFGPLSPLKPMDGTQAEGPRRWQYNPGYNINIQPRASEGLTPFEWLINIAKTYDVASLCIRYRMQEMMAMEWEIVDLDLENPASTQEKLDARQRLAKPDGITPWTTWIGTVVDEMMVTDALSIFNRKTNAGGTFGWELLNGATIKVLVDVNGRTPMPPNIAYQQILYGRPHWEADAATLRYAPMHRSTRSVYGRSPTEDLIININRALRRQIHDLNYYAHGNVPEALISAPDLQPEQIEQLQTYLDTVVSKPDQRRKLHMMPSPNGRFTVFQFKPPQLDTIVEEFLDKRTLAAYAVPPQELGFTNDVNRATAGLQENTLLRRRLPFIKFLGALITDMLHDEGYRNIKIQFAAEKPEEDKLRQAQVDKLDISIGKRTIDEIRKRDGMMPLGINEPFVLTPAGPVNLKDALALPIEALLGVGSQGNANGKDKNGPDTSSGDNLSNSEKAERISRIEEELRQWERFATRRVGQPAGRPFMFENVPVGFRDMLDDAVGNAQDAESLRDLRRETLETIRRGEADA